MQRMSSRAIYFWVNALKNAPLFDLFHSLLHSLLHALYMAGVDKGVALGLLCNHLQIPIENTVAFGDGENDKEFLSAAGVGCAMKNARPAAKNAANIVIDVSYLI